VDRVHGVVDQRRHGPWWTMDRGATGVRARRRCGAQLLAAMIWGARGRCGEPSDGITWGGEVVRRASGGGEWNPAVMVGVEALGRGGGQMRPGRGAGGRRRGVAPFYRVRVSELKRSGEADGRRRWGFSTSHFEE
jgi:hypothetical protein